MRILPLFVFIILSACNDKGQQIDQSFDIVIVGGGASGSMAGIQAARLGSNTLIIEETQWLGGMLTSAGVSAIDGNYKLYSGLWQEFRQELYDYYGGADSVKTGWVSNVLFEPNVGADILLGMANKEKVLDVWFESSISSLEFDDNRWKIIVLKNGVKKALVADIVIDGTELGDISKMAGVPYDIGMDSRDETGEDIAPAQSNDIIQDLTYVAILKEYRDDHRLIEKPEDYDPSFFYCTCAGKCDQDTISRKIWDCSQMINYGKLPNNKYMINWPIFGNDYYVNAIDLDKAGRNNAYEKAKHFTKCYLYYLQHDLGFDHLGIADDVFPTEDGLPFFPYHRESRRIRGIVRFDINDLADPFSQEDALYRTGIAVGDYPIDHHHEAYPSSMDLPDLHFYLVPSYGLPVGTLIPENVKNFIVAEKSISVTNLVNGTTRLQPVCLLIGQAAGVLAHLSTKNAISPIEVSVRDVQDILLKHGAYIMPYSDVSPADKAFNAVQRIGATGILQGEGKNIGWENHTLFHPDSILTFDCIVEGFKEFDSDFKLGPNNDPYTVEEAVNLITEFKLFVATNNHLDSLNLLEIWDEFQLGAIDRNSTITRKQFAILLDKMVDPFHIKQVDHLGEFVD